MSKHETIEAIRTHNPSAFPEFLTHFNQRQLEAYLKRLELVKGHRGRLSGWIREGDTPAVVTRRAG